MIYIPRVFVVDCDVVDFGVVTVVVFVGCGVVVIVGVLLVVVDEAVVSTDGSEYNIFILNATFLCFFFHILCLYFNYYIFLFR